MLATQMQATGATAAAYEMTEEARMLLADEEGLLEVTRAVGEAAYYLSDPLEPDERALLLSEAEGHCERHRHDSREDATAGALNLLRDAVVDVEAVSRGPNASSEVRIALRALREALTELAPAGLRDPCNGIGRRLRFRG